MERVSLPATFGKLLGWGKVLAPLRHAPKLPTAIVLLVVVVAVFAPVIAPYDPTSIELKAREMPPAFLEGGSMEHILGTDRTGRDILSRVIMGTRVSLSVAVLAIIAGGLVGTTLGLLAGYSGGWVDAFIMRVVDVTLAFPGLLIGLVFAATVGPGFEVVVIILAFIMWSRYARLVRSEVLSIKERDFVALARIAGCSRARIIVVHVLPNVVNSVVVLCTLQVGWTIIVEASLSFLGVGIPPPTPTWGGMMAEGRNYLDQFWWIAIFPGIAIMLVVLSFNMFGDWLRDVLDPKLTQL